MRRKFHTPPLILKSPCDHYAGNRYLVLDTVPIPLLLLWPLNHLLPFPEVYSTPVAGSSPLPVTLRFLHLPLSHTLFVPTVGVPFLLRFSASVENVFFVFPCEVPPLHHPGVVEAPHRGN
jgi:hypothetical protein